MIAPGAAERQAPLPGRRPDRGSAGEALLVYRKDGVDWAGYRQAHLAPVTIWATDASAFRDFSPADRQALANRFYAITYAELEKDYQMVGAPGPGVLEVQLALTDAQASNPALDTVSTVMPIGLAASTLAGVVTGKPSFVGAAQAEGRILDGSSGELLAAAVDRRVGGKAIAGSADSKRPSSTGRSSSATASAPTGASAAASRRRDAPRPERSEARAPCLLA